MSPPATHPLGPLAVGVATLLLSWAAPAAAQTPDPGQSEVNAAPTSVPADGTTASTITVTLRDSVGNQLPTGGDTVELATDFGVLSAVNDRGNGTYTATITSLNWGTATITATVNTNPIPGNATVEFTATALRFSTQPSTTEVNANIAPPVRVEAIDGAGDRVTSFTGTVDIAIQNDPSGGSAALGGTTTRAANNGVAAFNSLSINEIGNGYTLQATSAGLTPVESIGFDIIPAAATELRFDVQPSNTQVGATITPAVTIRATDGTGTTDTNYSGTITVAIQNNPGGGNLSGTLSQPAVNGVATFNDLSIDAVGNAYTLQATSNPVLTPDTSNGFNITSVPATELRFGVQPSNTQVDATITPAVTVRATDGTGITDTGFSGTISVAIQNNPGGGNLSGTLSRPAVNGVATFNDLSIDAVGNGYTLQATSNPVLTPDTSNGFNITSAPATELRFVQQPTTTVAGQTIAPAVTVEATDGSGTRDTNFSGTITIAIQNNPGGGNLGGTASQLAVNGLATFNNLSIDSPGNGYTLQATSGALTPDTSNGFNITPAPATELRFVQQPTTTVAGQTIAPAVTVEATDGIGNRDTNFSGTVTIAIQNNAGGGTLSGTASQLAANGVATFNNLSINKTGTGYTLQASSGGLSPDTSDAFNITPAAATELRFQQQPTNTQAGATILPAVTVHALDANDNLATGFSGSVTLAIASNPGGGTLSPSPATVTAVNGVATFANLSIDAAGNGYTLQTTGGGLASDTSDPFDIFPGNAVDIEFVQQPTTTVAGQTIAPAVTVRALDGNGNTSTSFTGAITVGIADNPGSGTLSPSPATVIAVNGIATFNNLAIDKSGVGYTLNAQGSGFADTSDPFDIVPGPPSGATSIITANPTAIPADGASTSTITVELFDANGNPLTSGGQTVLVSTTVGSLGGTIDNGDGTYTAILTASTLPQTATITGTVNATPITDTATVAFVIGSADRLEIMQQPSTTAVGALFVPRVSVRVVDANGNTVPSFTGPISAAIGNNPGGGSLIGTTTVNAVGGTATFPNLAISQAGSGYTLVFSAAGFTPVTSIPFTVTAGGASGATSTITANPTSIPADGASTSTITVQLKDAGGSNETSGGDLVTLSTTAGTLSSVTDNNDGTYTATLTSSTAPGTATITGTVNGGPITSSAAVTFSAGSADLAIAAAVSNPNPTLGSTIVYTITVTNSGPDTATGVQVTDALPSRLSLVSAEASQGTFTVATGVWNVGELEPGASATLALTANVGP